MIGDSKPIPNNHDLWISDEDFQKIIDSSGVELTPFEWIWRVSQGGSIGESALDALNINHEVPAVTSLSGGHSSALVRLNRYLEEGLSLIHI